MSKFAKAKALMNIINNTAIHLTDEEISDIGVVLIKALDRIAKETTDEEKAPTDASQ